MSSHTPKKNSSSLLTNTYSAEEKLKPLQIPIDDDKEYIEAIKEASFWCSAKCLRQLFCTMLLSNNTITPENIWNATWKILSTDISCNERKKMDDTSKILFFSKKGG